MKRATVSDKRKATPKPEKSQAHKRLISDKFLLYCLGLSDVLNPFWDWKLSSKEEIPKNEILEPEFSAAVKVAAAKGCNPEVIYSCVNYARSARRLRLADWKTLEPLIGRCNKAAEMMGKYKLEITILARACNIYPPPWPQAAADDDLTVDFTDMFLLEDPEDRAVIYAQSLLRWCANVAQAWAPPNPVLLSNGALPLSVYVDMIYSIQRPAQKNAQPAVANILTSLKNKSTAQEVSPEHDIDPLTLGKNLLNFARRSPGVLVQLRRKLRALHQFAAKS